MPTEPVELILLGIIVLFGTILLLGFWQTWTEKAESTHAGKRIQGPR